jgi:hypothetical protein
LCSRSFESIESFESHYGSFHRFECKTCHVTLPSAHLLNLHITECHDSYFQALLAQYKKNRKKQLQDISNLKQSEDRTMMMMEEEEEEGENEEIRIKGNSFNSSGQVLFPSSTGESVNTSQAFQSQPPLIPSSATLIPTASSSKAPVPQNIYKRNGLFQCLVESCKKTFENPRARSFHCRDVHGFSSFTLGQMRRKLSVRKREGRRRKKSSETGMDVDLTREMGKLTVNVPKSISFGRRRPRH